jgi:hypothetical protein
LEQSPIPGRFNPTLSSLLDRWMEHITSLGRADTTLYHYRRYIDREIVPVLGTIRLSRLKALDTALAARTTRPQTSSHARSTDRWHG